MSEVKVGLEVDGKRDYFRIQTGLSLKQNIEAICEEFNLSPIENYGLKFWNNPESVDSVYITDENFRTIRNGIFLKVVDSLNIVTFRIFKNLNSNFFNENGFKELMSLSTDEGFIKFLFLVDKHLEILNIIQREKLPPSQMAACMAVIFSLLKWGYFKEIDIKVVEKVIIFVKSEEPALTDIQYGLLVLCQILYLKKRAFDIPKRKILAELSVDNVINFVASDTQPRLQYNALMLINALAKYSSKDERRKIVRELNKIQNKQIIFSGIIKNKCVIPNVAHEIYVYQTYMLSIYSDALLEKAKMDDLCEILTTDPPRKSIVDSTENSLSTMSLNSIQSNIDRSSFGSINEENLDDNDNVERCKDYSELSHICQLTCRALSYYRRYNSNYFFCSEREERACGQDILITADKVIGVLAKVLDIGQEPSKTSEFYHPILFNTSLRLPFLYELFSRVMVMVSKTRREMRGYSSQDYEKIFIVVEKEIRLLLEKKPMTYKDLTKYNRLLTYSIVAEEWEKEKKQEWKNLLENHPSVLEMRKNVEEEYKKNIFEQRIKIIENGGIFPKIYEKKIRKQLFFLRLSENKRSIQWGDWDDIQQKGKNVNNVPVSEIKFFVTGKACQLVKDNIVKEYERIFSIYLSDNRTIDCLAENKNMCNVWADAFYLLLGKEIRSENYRNELKMLVDMECTLKLLDLQEVSIPFEPPPIPPLPKSLPI